jgi:hypothetical protein
MHKSRRLRSFTSWAFLFCASLLLVASLASGQDKAQDNDDTFNAEIIKGTEGLRRQK